jgi:DNA alkylation repair enzyme
MNVSDVMEALQQFGDEKIKKILMKHGVKEPLFGVRVEHLKVIQKQIKKDYQLAKQLYDTGNADAMYLAGLVADDAKMTSADLSDWVQKAVSTNISEYTVPWVAAGSPEGYAAALEWIDSDTATIAASGWATLSCIVAMTPDAKLDIEKIRQLLERVVVQIHAAPNRVRYCMNGFVIAVGTYVQSLSATALECSDKIGVVQIDENGTACKVPSATVAIAKATAGAKAFTKKKTVKC